MKKEERKKPGSNGHFLFPFTSYKVPYIHMYVLMKKKKRNVSGLGMRKKKFHFESMWYLATKYNPSNKSTLNYRDTVESGVNKLFFKKITIFSLLDI